jgi:hypothetical protein
MGDELLGRSIRVIERALLSGATNSDLWLNRLVKEFLYSRLGTSFRKTFRPSDSLYRHSMIAASRIAEPDKVQRVFVCSDND